MKKTIRIFFFEKVLEMVRGISHLNMEVCCTLGMITESQALRLAEAGLHYYNHNLDTSEAYYKEIISTKDPRHHHQVMLVVLALARPQTSSVEALQDTVKGWITRNEIGFGKIMMPLRVALVGALEGVDVFDIIYLIGKSETIRRIQSLIDRH